MAEWKNGRSFRDFRNDREVGLPAKPFRSWTPKFLPFPAFRLGVLFTPKRGDVKPVKASCRMQKIKAIILPHGKTEKPKTTTTTTTTT
jgi:hypothetical protein